MWNRKQLKAEGKKTFEGNYWQSILVSLFVVILASTRGLSRVGEIKTGAALSDIGLNRIGSEISGLTDTSGEVASFLISKSHATQGILATILNETSDSGSFIYGLFNGINELLFNNSISHGIILIVAALVLFIYWCFFQNIVQVGKYRFFLESRIYPETKFGRILYIYRLKRVGNVAHVMFLKALFLSLWWLTIVGGIIKIYSYRMIPAILAENPSISWKDAFRLSKQMMNGNKWNTFKLDLSFIGWIILSFVTFGLVSVFFLHPYRISTDMELYMTLREATLKEHPAEIRYYNDKWLDQKPIGKYHAGQEDEENNSYPVALFSIPDRHKSHVMNLDAARKYSLTDLVLLFFSISIIGYLYEVLYYIVAIGEVVNRGTMYGPWLPVYGCGGVITLLLLRKWVDRPLLTFGLSVGLCGIIEYSTAWYLETFEHTKWWDYSGFFMNIQGRVCLEQLIVFGLGCCLNIYFLSPLAAGFFNRMPKKWIIAICIIIGALFITDFIISINNPNMAAGVSF